MPPLTVVAKVVAKHGTVEKVRPELLKLIAPTRMEKGCINYTLHQDNDEPEVFIFHETWDSLDSLEQHMNTAHFKNYLLAVEGMIADKMVHKMTIIE